MSSWLGRRCTAAGRPASNQQSVRLAGNNTFVSNVTGGPAAPFFGSLGGGMLLYPYLNFLSQFDYTTVPEAKAFILVVCRRSTVALTSRASAVVGDSVA